MSAVEDSCLSAGEKEQVQHSNSVFHISTVEECHTCRARRVTWVWISRKESSLERWKSFHYPLVLHNVCTQEGRKTHLKSKLSHITLSSLRSLQKLLENKSWGISSVQESFWKDILYLWKEKWQNVYTPFHWKYIYIYIYIYFSPPWNGVVGTAGRSGFKTPRLPYQSIPSHTIPYLWSDLE